MSENNTNIENILNALDDIRNKTTYAVYIPSKKREYMFKEISTAQEKRLIKSIIDNPIFGTQLIYALREMILENSADDLDIDSLTVLDKLAICLNLRCKSIGSMFTHEVSGNDDNGKKYNKTIELNIDDIIKQVNAVEIPNIQTFSNDNISITCALPTIKDEYDLEIAMGRKLADYAEMSPDDVSNVVESVFIGEIIKYIKTITLEINGEMCEISLVGLEFKVRQQFIEKLGASLTADVLDYIKIYNNSIKTALTHFDSEITIEVTSGFFSR